MLIRYLCVFLGFNCAFTLACMGSSLENLHYITEEYLPYNYTEQGKLTGISVEMIRKIWDELGVKHQKIDVLPWARAYYEIEHMDNRVVFAMAQKKARLAKFQWACPIVTGHINSLIALKSSKITINTVADLREYVIGSIRNDSSEEDLLALTGYSRNISKNVSVSANLALLNKDRVQLIAYEKEAAFKMIAELGYDVNLYEAVYDLTTAQTCYAFSLSVNPQLVFEFQQALNKFIKTAEYKALEQHFFPY